MLYVFFSQRRDVDVEVLFQQFKPPTLSNQHHGQVGLLQGDLQEVIKQGPCSEEIGNYYPAERSVDFW